MQWVNATSYSASDMTWAWTYQSIFGNATQVGSISTSYFLTAESDTLSVPCIATRCH